MTEAELSKIFEGLKGLIAEEVAKGDPSTLEAVKYVLPCLLVLQCALLDMHRAADALQTLASSGTELDRYRHIYGPLEATGE